MFIFINFTLYIAKQKKVSQLYKISFADESYDLVLNKQLVSFLNTPVLIDKENILMRDLIIKARENRNYVGQIEQEMQKVVNVVNSKCFILKTFTEEFDERERRNFLSPVATFYAQNKGFESTSPLINLPIEEGAFLDIIDGQEKIKVQMYIDKEGDYC